MTFLLKRGKRAINGQARAHLAKYNPHGDISGAWCGRTSFNVESNVPWGLKVCRDCRKKAAR